MIAARPVMTWKAPIRPRAHAAKAMPPAAQPDMGWSRGSMKSGLPGRPGTSEVAMVRSVAAPRTSPRHPSRVIILAGGGPVTRTVVTVADRATRRGPRPGPDARGHHALRGTGRPRDR